MGHTEIFNQHVSGKYVNSGQILDSATVVDDHCLGRIRRRLLQVNIQWRYAALYIGVQQYYLVVFDQCRFGCFIADFGKQLGCKAAVIQSQVFEGLHIQKSPGAIMLKNIIVFFHHLLGCCSLGRTESVPNKFIDEIIVGHIKGDHDHAMFSRSIIELILAADLLMAKQISIKLGFPMLMISQANIEFSDAFAGHQRF